MIQTFSSTIRRKEMDAVLTCMVDEKTGPGELNTRFIQAVKEFTGCDGAVAFRSPTLALSYALKALSLESESGIMISALAPAWQYQTVENLGFKPVVLDVSEETGLVTAETVSKGIQEGGRLLLLHETMGILPDFEAILALGVPVIEDISHSVGAVFNEKKAGSSGVYSIMGLEEFDTITAGGGAVLMAPGRREWIVLKKYTDEAPRTDILPDINSALAFVQIKEFARNEEMRKKLFAVFQHALLSGKNKTFVREPNSGSTVWSFPVVLGGSFKDAKQYANRKEIEIQPAYADSVIALKEEELSASCIKAKSLFLRTVLFPLYPRLTNDAATKIAKVLGTLP
ncbi:MAG: DegT/DnrJ/EryC1/StrS family aminotransferase [Treponema sp.]|nr:DegT/DnrJ/EryC1/StrS family aminotransferase [Treponema sp.]